ncbi:MAG: glycoside hydrolase family 13 protein [Gemmatimonadota bacterium]
MPQPRALARLVLPALAFSLACAPESADTDVTAEPSGAMTARSDSVPRWAQEAIWYQVFVERFRNGDPANDPTLADMEGSWPHLRPPGWAPTPWGWDWYRQEPWARDSGREFYTTVQARRYGGDLQGLVDRLDDLQELGVTALYLNPVNDAPSLHKYDARTYRHIDRNFGPDPRGDVARMAAEDPLDPATWVWTAADSLFLDLVDRVHARGMRIIVDYSWNHTGATFWAWRDVLRNQEDSPFAGWYEIEAFDDPATPDTSEFAYRGWAGVPELPELRKVGRPPGETHGAIEGTLVPEVRAHIFNVTRRWLDPDGDGDPSDGVDGFRLDVAEMVPLGFWREYRDTVRTLNPDALLVGEVWWEDWPDRMYDPAPWLQGDVFDAVMNYRWYRPTRGFFTSAPPDLSPSGYWDALQAVAEGIAEARIKAQMNLTASHDSPRFATSLQNPGRYKFRVNPREDPDYDLGPADATTRTRQELILLQQFTWVGAPHVWNGDEVGMWGADDPDNRKPLLWPDLSYEDEEADPFGRSRPATPVRRDVELRELYRELIALRKEHLALFVDGTARPLLTDDARGILVYERALGGAERAVVAFNVGDAEVTVDVPVPSGRYRRAAAVGEARGSTRPAPLAVEEESASLSLRLPASGGVVWIRERP